MLVRTNCVIVEPGFEDWKGDWQDANPDTLRLVRELVDENPSNAAAYEVTNASANGALRCVAPERRHVGIAAQVYALWSDNSGGIGDLADVADLARRSGADVLLLSPLHAPRPGLPQEASPYFPSSRQYRNPLHLRVDGVRLPSDIATPIDRDTVWRAKFRALEQEWTKFSGDADFDRYRRAEGEDLRRYARFCAQHEGTAEFHEWVQWLLDTQLRDAAAAGAGLIHDIAVGFDPSGADAWMWQDLIASGFHVGAPPDEFNREGQDWGLPPFVPDKLAAAGYRPIVGALESAARHGAGLRIDHVMGLFRLYWIPEGASPADGVYVRYPAAELLDAVARVSQEHDCFVVGEDLGTVEPGVREALQARNILSYKVLWFEDDAPSQWPPLSLASVTTHDLVTIAAAATDEATDEVIRQRLRRATEGADPADLAQAVHRRLMTAASAVIVMTAEDLLGVVEQPNLPGTTDEWNWSRRLPGSVAEVAAAFREQTA